MSRSRRQLKGLVREANRAYNRAIDDGVLTNEELLSMLSMFQDVADTIQEQLTHTNPEQCYMGYTTALVFGNDMSEAQIRKQAEKDGFDADMVVFLSQYVDDGVKRNNPRPHRPGREGRNFGYGGNNGAMAKSQLRTLKRTAVEFHDAIRDADELPDWVLSKITVAVDRVVTAKDYILSKLRRMELEDDPTYDDWD